MAKKNQAPEEFIRDYIKRGFTREQILSKASKKDNGFYHLVSEILNHTTLIEKIEQQVDGIQQSQINFEKQSYSSKTILDDINQQIEIQKQNNKEIRLTVKPRDNGRSNLPVHTDLEMNDLDAPLSNTYTTKKIAYSIHMPKKESNAVEKEVTLFDDIPLVTQESKAAAAENKLKIYPKAHKETASDETSKLPEAKMPEAKIEEIFENANASGNPLTESKIEESSNYTDLEKEKLISMLRQKEILLAELNRNLGQKEAEIHVDRKIAGERKSRQAAEIKDLRQKTSIYRIGLYMAVGIFTFTVCIIKIANLNSTTNSIMSRPSKNNIAKIKELEGQFVADQTSKVPEPFIVNVDSDNPPVVTPEAAPKPQITHVIKRGETFWRITSKYLGKENAHLYKKLMEYNNISGESALEGKTIKIPTLAELEAE